MERQFEQSASESINAQWPTLAANGGAHERRLVKLLLTLVDNRYMIIKLYNITIIVCA